MFRVVEKKLQMPEFGGIVEESLNCSIFGIFGKQYKLFQSKLQKEEKHNYLNFFSQSEILTEDLQLFKALLYFNLPYEAIVSKQVEPNLMFSFVPDQDDKNKNLGNLIEQFESQSEGKAGSKGKTAPSIILMKVDLGQEDNGEERCHIIGGYASHGWLVSGGMKQGHGNGDSSCFLFNLTLSLRFNAREAMPYYQHVTGGEEIRFGNTDLVLKDGFSNVTSQITAPTQRGGKQPSSSGGSHFCFGNDLTQKNRVESIIPGEHKFTPSKLEVWGFFL